MVAHSKEPTMFYRSNTGTVISNPARSMDACLRFSVSCCPVQVEALRCADPWSKESYQVYKMIQSFKS